jgi:hypothetical protein
MLKVLDEFECVPGSYGGTMVEDQMEGSAPSTA